MLKILQNLKGIFLQYFLKISVLCGRRIALYGIAYCWYCIQTVRRYRDAISSEFLTWLEKNHKLQVLTFPGFSLNFSSHSFEFILEIYFSTFDYSTTVAIRDVVLYFVSKFRLICEKNK